MGEGRHVGMAACGRGGIGERKYGGVEAWEGQGTVRSDMEGGVG